MDAEPIINRSTNVELDLVRGRLGSLTADLAGLHLDHHGGHFVFWVRHGIEPPDSCWRAWILFGMWGRSPLRVSLKLRSFHLQRLSSSFADSKAVLERPAGEIPPGESIVERCWRPGSPAEVSLTLFG